MHFFGDVEGNSEEFVDCEGSKDQNLHELVITQIISVIRKNISQIIFNF